jgi:hypothetical protein
MIYAAILLALLLGGLAVVLWQVRRRHLDRWLVPYVCQLPRRRAPRRGEPIHVLLCIADHYEPKVGNPAPEVARARVERWRTEYPRLFGQFRDSDGRPPRHTFFFPAEEYEPEYLDALAELCRAGFGEVEIHLHHDQDTTEGLRRKLLDFKNVLAERHGLLARRRDTGAVAYGFIHGNWALCNSRPDGRHCGVNNELDVLRETGCYADFTLPSAPSPTQIGKINSVYYAWDRPGRPCSHATGLDVGQGTPPPKSLMLIQGPLLFDWRRRRRGLVPRVENACLQGNQPPTLERLDLWLKARVQVAGRPDWFFVKLHTHGAREGNARMLLGEPMVRFHEALARRAEEEVRFFYHYVTAREMYNLVRAAAAGWRGPVAAMRDFAVLANGLYAGAAPGLPPSATDSHERFEQPSPVI